MLVEVRSEQLGVVFQQQPVPHQLLRRLRNRRGAVALVRVALRHRQAWIVVLEPLLAGRGPALSGLVGKAQVFTSSDLALAGAKCCRFESRNSLTSSGMASALPSVSVTTSDARC